ncbi:hypothetical protein FYK55_27545 [Roseiconus nitratireducens]|uniref:DUF3015 domain-containing protein n=1 Tax=Roseiconus nitratireducens TaxID=2605748 RepID=A0A5M6CT50_9BACT|nr:hypothetical protein [Roseiconus nitratireducens]KAA5538498.1 hypothetical protein FYK55_27545 [Roseiconus nitratireducens]
MNKLLFCIAFVCCTTVSANVNGEDALNGDATFNAKAEGGIFSGMFGGMADVTIQISDKYLDYLAKPETAKKLATFQKNYYDSLIELGFDEQQAFTLLRDLGNPMIGHGQNRNAD